MVPVPRTKLVPSPGQASPAGRAYGPPPSCGGAGQRGGDGDADAVPPGLGETRSRAVLAWARSESRRVMLLPKETLGSRGGGGGGGGSCRRFPASSHPYPAAPPPPTSRSPRPRNSFGRPRSAGGLCGCFPGRKKRCLQISLSAGFPVPERRRFPGMAATPVIPSRGCGWCVRAG